MPADFPAKSLVSVMETISNPVRIHRLFSKEKKKNHWKAKPMMAEALKSTFLSLCPNFSLIYSFANPNFPVLCLQASLMWKHIRLLQLAAT